MNQVNQIPVDGNVRGIALGKLLDDLGWGVLLITIGALSLVPEKFVPQGSWLIAAGLILLDLNAIRYFSRIEMNGLSFVVGTLALLAGVGLFLKVSVPLFPIALIVIGVCMLLVPLSERRSNTSAAQGWHCCD